MRLPLRNSVVVISDNLKKTNVPLKMGVVYELPLFETNAAVCYFQSQAGVKVSIVY